MTRKHEGATIALLSLWKGIASPNAFLLSPPHKVVLGFQSNRYCSQNGNVLINQVCDWRFKSTFCYGWLTSASRSETCERLLRHIQLVLWLMAPVRVVMEKNIEELIRDMTGWNARLPCVLSHINHFLNIPFVGLCTRKCRSMQPLPPFSAVTFNTAATSSFLQGRGTRY